MSKRDNRVGLDGLLWMESYGPVNVDGQYALAVRCCVKTDHAHMGGHHPVVAYGRLAAEIMAFTTAGKLLNEQVEANLDGWLWSGDHSTTIAENVRFRVDSKQRQIAKIILAQLLDGRTQFDIDGRKVSIEQVFPRLKKVNTGQLFEHPIRNGDR